MSPVDWTKFYGPDGKPRTVEPHQPRFRRDQLPADVQADLDNPLRPKPEMGKEIYPIIHVLYHNCEAYRRLHTGTDVHTSEEDLAWGRAQLRMRGYEPGVLASDGSDFRWYGFLEAVYYGIMVVLRSEVAAYTRSLEARDDDDEEATAKKTPWDIVAPLPEDGDGLGYEDAAALIGISARLARSRFPEWVRDGYLSEAPDPNAKGGRPPKLFWRRPKLDESDA